MWIKNHNFTFVLQPYYNKQCPPVPPFFREAVFCSSYHELFFSSFYDLFVK